MSDQKWGTGLVRPEQGLLRLRKEMGTFGNLRPCNFASDSLVDISPLKASVCRGVDFTIIRELTGGIYFGERKEDDGDGNAWDTEPYSRAEIERVTRLAAHLALQTSPPAKVWSLDKANVLATSRLWRKVVSEVMAKEFPQLELGHQLIDSAAMVMVRDPRALNGVVVTSNLFGDIISDEASVIPGSLGLLPSASLSGIPDGQSRVNGIYEPIHGEWQSNGRFDSGPLIFGRLGAGHLRQRHRQPRGSNPLNGNAPSVFLESAERGKSSRRGCQEDYRWRCTDWRHRRKSKHERSGRCGCEGAREDTVSLRRGSVTPPKTNEGP